MSEKRPLCIYDTGVEELASGDTLPSSGSGFPDTFVGTAGEALSQYGVVYSNASDSGELWIATNNGTPEQADAIGIVVESGGIADGATGAIHRLGSLTNAGWSLTPGATIWLGVDGALTETMPSAGSYAKPLGYVEESGDSIWFAPQLGWLVGYPVELSEVPPGHTGRIELVSTTQIEWAGYKFPGWDATKGRDIEIIPSSIPVLNYNDNDVDGNPLVAGYPYDLFLETVSATSAVIKAKKFTNATTRSVTPALWHGRERYDNTTDTGKKRLWIGTIYLDTGPVFKDANATRFIWNQYNRQVRAFGVQCPYSSNTYQTPTTSWVALMSTTYTSQVVLGANDAVISLYGTLVLATGEAWTSAVIGLDGTASVVNSLVATAYTTGSATLGYQGVPGLGYHYFLPYIAGASGSSEARVFYSATGLDARFSLLGEVLM